MGTRGRRSSAELTTVPTGSVTAIHRPTAPAELTDEQSAEWRAIVSRLPADWFPRETWPVLAAYCRHVVSARRVSQMIEAYVESDAFDASGYEQLLRMQERESRALTALGRSMRLTQQSTYDRQKAKPIRASKAPWSQGGE